MTLDEMIATVKTLTRQERLDLLAGILKSLPPAEVDRILGLDPQTPDSPAKP